MTTGKFDIDSKDFDLEECMAQAQQGNPDAQASIAYCYIRGKHGLKTDTPKGFEYLQKCFTYLCKSAESGEGRSMALLGLCYEEGTGVEKDDAQAYEWYRKSAEAGDAYGMALLGGCYKCGKGVEKDDAQAYEWYRKSAEAGDEIGMGLLRLCYEHGTGVEKFEQKSSITTTIPQNNYNEPVFKEEPVKKVHPELSEQYSFENFISSDENAYVFNAALAVSKNPGIAYNPLLIYGGVGLGKTHLMKAIGYSIFQSTSYKNVIYISAENFTNEFTQSIRDRSEKKFKDKYRNADVLLIDDIHFFEDKDKTQEELFHTFNALYDKQKQMVFTCDRPVSELKQITERLKSRFTRGVSADIHMPKYEVRSAIIQHKLEQQGKKLSPEIIDLISKTIQTNVRDLEACLNSITLYSDITAGNLSLSQAKDIITKMFAQDTTQITAEIIQRVVAEYFNVSYTDIR